MHEATRGMRLLQGDPLLPHTQTLVALLDEAAGRAPERAFLVERDARNARAELTFAQAAATSQRIAAALLALGASAQRPLLILSGNGIDHALMTFGALRAEIPVVPVSPLAGRAAHDGFARLRAIVDTVRPGVVFARDGRLYADAVRALCSDVPFVCVHEAPRDLSAFDYAALHAFAPLAAAPAIGPATVAKILFTSGSTGTPKGVVTTHGMICAMQQAIAQAWPFLADRPPVMVDWLPWSHCFGGNKVLGIALRHAGTLHIDDGNPTPERFERSAQLRGEVAPTLAFDVPLGWRAWSRRLRADEALRRRWLSRLDLGCWGGATLDAATRRALRELGVPLAAGWGATETSPTVTLTAGDAPGDAIGVPVAGVELKLVPNGDAYEARVRGPQVMPGYFARPDLTAAAFDEEGFYRIGDVVRPLAARAPQRGLAFVARVDDRFKLASGTWVRAAELREAFLAACGDAAEAFVTGEGAETVGVIVWLTPEAAARPPKTQRERIAAAMRGVAIGDGSAGRPRRAVIAGDPPHVHERTEKGTLVRRTVLTQRAALVARLHAPVPDAGVIAV